MNIVDSSGWIEYIVHRDRAVHRESSAAITIAPLLDERDIHEGLRGSQKFNFPRCVNEAITL
jgi:hypothetical protein